MTCRPGVRLGAVGGHVAWLTVKIKSLASCTEMVHGASQKLAALDTLLDGVSAALSEEKEFLLSEVHRCMYVGWLVVSQPAGCMPVIIILKQQLSLTGSWLRVAALWCVVVLVCVCVCVLCVCVLSCLFRCARRRRSTSCGTFSVSTKCCAIRNATWAYRACGPWRCVRACLRACLRACVRGLYHAAFHASRRRSCLPQRLHWCTGMYVLNALGTATIAHTTPKYWIDFLRARGGCTYLLLTPTQTPRLHNCVALHWSDRGPSHCRRGISTAIEGAPTPTARGGWLVGWSVGADLHFLLPVSYTHLTLPTIYSV